LNKCEQLGEHGAARQAIVGELALLAFVSNVNAGKSNLLFMHGR
jgi:hypothetical protein